MYHNYNNTVNHNNVGGVNFMYLKDILKYWSADINRMATRHKCEWMSEVACVLHAKQYWYESSEYCVRAWVVKLSSVMFYLQGANTFHLSLW